MKFSLQSKTIRPPARLLRGASLALALLLGAAGSPAQSITVEELADRMVGGGTPPFVIDVRLSHEFEQSHIPSAISVPLAMLASRRLPPAGDVVVYGDGLGRTDMERARQILEGKPGLNPLILEGGFAAWETRSGFSTGTKGFQQPDDGFITYQQLVDSGGEGVVIYDLRKGRENAGQPARLADYFPKARLGRGSPYALLGGQGGGGGSAQGAQPMARGAPNPLLRGNAVSTDELVVLIDDDNESAAKAAARLRAAGYSRVQVLAGGELILDFEGRTGLERRSGGSVKLPSAQAPAQPGGGKP